MQFKDIPFHEEAKKRLIEMADSGCVPHALMLEGPSGTYKFALARAFVQYLHCTGRRDGDSCGECASCRQHQKFNQIDTYYSFPVVKKGDNPISADFIYDFYDFLKDSPSMDFERWLVALDNINAQPLLYVSEGSEISRWLSFTSVGAGRKVVLMWLPERLHEAAANKLLKILEEPNDNSMFVLTSDNPGVILPTIYSRLQRIRVPRYTDEETARILTENYGVEPDVAHSIAPVAEGNISKAVSLISLSKQRNEFFELFKQLMRLAYSRKVAELKEWSIKAGGLGREPLMAFFDYCTTLLRENFILNLHNPELSAMTAEEAQFCSRFCPYINERNVLGFIETFDNAKTDIAGNGNAKLICFDIALRCILLIIK